MPDATEFTDPVGYSFLWVALPGVLVALVVIYYVGIWWWAAETAVEEEQAPVPVLDRARRDCLRRIDGLERMVTSGSMAPRRAFQELSAAVRGFVDEVSDVPATVMALEDLRQSAAPKVADTIAGMYPPEFAPGASESDQFRSSLRQARELVTTWR